MQLQRLVITPEQLHNGRIALVPSQRHYLQGVLRLGWGDRFIAMDGQGNAWLATLKQALDPLEYQAEILEALTVQTELPATVTLVAALPKGNGFDEVVRQSTELGVSCIAPVLSDRTLLKPSPQKWERWQRIAQEAAEQSERQIAPTVMEPKPFAAHLQQETQQLSPPSTRKFLCVARGATTHLLDCLLTAANPPSDRSPITLAIGPEGGWTNTEIEHAIAAGYQLVSLGDRIFRAVTAPLVALSIIAATLERVKHEA